MTCPYSDDTRVQEILAGYLYYPPELPGRIAEALREAGFQDIKTAPRDGTPVLLWWGGDCAPVASWQCFEGGDEDGTGWTFGWLLEDESLSLNGDGWLVYEDEPVPTHWMPKPQAEEVDD